MTSGTVTLTRGTDVFQIPAERVLWTAVAVTFTVPRDLPTSAAPQTWQVTVQPTGWAACGPYPMQVLAIPAILSVPPTSVSERRLDLVTVGAGANSAVRFYLTMRLRSPSTTRLRPRDAPERRCLDDHGRTRAPRSGP